VKELLKSDSTCESYAQIKKDPIFLTHSVHYVTLKQISADLFLAVLHTLYGAFSVRTSKWQISINERVGKTSEHFQTEICNSRYHASKT